jgi:hypothetical protein
MHRVHALRSAALLLACTAFAPAPVAVAQGLSLAWEDCRAPAGAGLTNRGFGCVSNIVEIPLFPSFTLATSVDSVLAVELVIDVDVAADSLPEWWRMDPGQCRANAWSANVSFAGSCEDPWGGVGAATVQGWLPSVPGGSGRHGRLLVTAGVLPAQAVTLSALSPYTACRVLLRTIESTTCPGCSVPACLVLNSILVRRLPGSSVEEILIGVAESSGSNFVLWQGGSGADCQSVPSRRSTWGAVKALYR